MHLLVDQQLVVVVVTRSSSSSKQQQTSTSTSRSSSTIVRQVCPLFETPTKIKTQTYLAATQHLPTISLLASPSEGVRTTWYEVPSTQVLTIPTQIYKQPLRTVLYLVAPLQHLTSNISTSLHLCFILCGFLQVS